MQAFQDWLLAKLEPLQDSRRILLRDPLQLLSASEGLLHVFARQHGFMVIVAATNLVFRELYGQALADPQIAKLLVIDRAPASRRQQTTILKAPPPFYPDLLAETPAEARIDLDLRQYLCETTGDPFWPQEVNQPRVARLIWRHLPGVLRAHQNLRHVHRQRFTDADLYTIVAYASLGVPEAAFKKLTAQDYWKIGLLGHGHWSELESLTPGVTQPLKKELGKAPAPFCWLVEHDPEIIMRAFYLAVILAQHTDQWKLLLANIDPALQPFAYLQAEVLAEAAPQLLRLNREQAYQDLTAAEDSLSKAALDFLLLDQLNLASPAGFAKVLQQEKYSTLFGALALLLALADLLSESPYQSAQDIVNDLLSTGGAEVGLIDTRPCPAWSHLKEAYGLTVSIKAKQHLLLKELKGLSVLKTEQLTFDMFRRIWNDAGINRLEFFLSKLERLLASAALLPRPESDLPQIFIQALEQIRCRCALLADNIHHSLEELNRRFQELIAAQYPAWAGKGESEKGKGESEKGKVKSEKCQGESAKEAGGPVLTSQFLRRVLKPYWDPLKEKAVIFLFDGMRYDIWDELLRPLLEDRMEILADLPALSLLPSETHISRKAVSAGAFPDDFDPKSGEDKLLKAGLSREFGYDGEVQVVNPEGSGVGETVRYRAGNLEMYIFELCDKELHKIRVKTLPDGRQVPARPLSFIYQQHLKNILDTEVMAMVRRLTPGTKVFIVADHGFGRVSRDWLTIDKTWLNQPEDCAYLNAWLRDSLPAVGAPAKVRQNVWEFPVTALRLPTVQTAIDKATKQTWNKHYATIIFPRTGSVFSRPGSPFNPDAYSHGGISLQELLIPMIVLRVRPQEEGLLRLEPITGPAEVMEGEEVEYRVWIKPTVAFYDTREEIKVEVEATISHADDQRDLPSQVFFVTSSGVEVTYRFRPEVQDATPEERHKGVMEQALTITLSYREGHRRRRLSKMQRFTVRLNPEQVVRRVPTHLGKILGLTPRQK